MKYKNKKYHTVETVAKSYRKMVPGRFAPNPVRPLSRFAPIPVRPWSFRPDLLKVL
jgi:hypothetical protein